MFCDVVTDSVTLFPTVRSLPFSDLLPALFRVHAVGWRRAPQWAPRHCGIIYNSAEQLRIDKMSGARCKVFPPCEEIF